MKIVVFGPDKRTGVLREGDVVDISGAAAKYLRERDGERNPVDLAKVMVPPDLGRFIEGGRRALDGAEQALEHLFGADDDLGPRGEQLVYSAGEVRLHAPRPAGGRVACAGGNFAEHSQAMAARRWKTSATRANGCAAGVSGGSGRWIGNRSATTAM